jgi:hypothetical protein
MEMVVGYGEFGAMQIDREYEDKYYALLKRMVLEELSDRSCTVFLFGSRVSGSYRWAADFDIGIEGLRPDEFIERKHRLLEQIEESVIPWNVDIVNFDEVDESFRETALKEYDLWKSA